MLQATTLVHEGRQFKNETVYMSGTHFTTAVSFGVLSLSAKEGLPTWSVARSSAATGTWTF